MMSVTFSLQIFTLSLIISFFAVRIIRDLSILIEPISDYNTIENISIKRKKAV